MHSRLVMWCSHYSASMAGTVKELYSYAAITFDISKENGINNKTGQGSVVVVSINNYPAQSYNASFR